MAERAENVNSAVLRLFEKQRKSGHSLKVRVNKQNHSLAKTILFFHMPYARHRPETSALLRQFRSRGLNGSSQTPGLRNVLSSHPLRSLENL